MTIRLEILDFLNCLQNEIMTFEVDPEISMFEDHPKIVDKMRMTVAALERMFPMIQAVDEVLMGDIQPKLFYKKWDKVKEHFDFPDDKINDIGPEVKGFLNGFGSEGETT